MSLKIGHLWSCSRNIPCFIKYLMKLHHIFNYNTGFGFFLKLFFFAETIRTYYYVLIVATPLQKTHRLRELRENVSTGIRTSHECFGIKIKILDYSEDFKLLTWFSNRNEVMVIIFSN